jgi:predicted dehydrogenase
MAPAFAAATDAEVTAIASRSREKAVEWAGRHGISCAYDSYEALLGDPEIEAIYIPLPNDLHAEWTLRALEAGKHVLCDKPAALTYADAKRMTGAARAANLRLMEGFMFRHHPQHARIARIVASGEIGEAAHFRGTFTFPGAGHAGHRWNPAQGGGALFDVGVYSINAARYHFRAEPESVAAVSVMDSEKGVDRHTAAILNFPGGRTATVEGGLDQVFTVRYEIIGYGGVVTTERAFQPGDGPVSVTIRAGSMGDEIRMEEAPGANHYVREIEHFGACVRDPAKDLWPGEDGAAQTRVVEAVRRSAAEGRRVPLAEIV